MQHHLYLRHLRAAPELIRAVPSSLSSSLLSLLRAFCSLSAGRPGFDAVRDPHVQREQPTGSLPQDRRVRKVVQPFQVSCESFCGYDRG